MTHLLKTHVNVLLTSSNKLNHLENLVNLLPLAENHVNINDLIIFHNEAFYAYDFIDSYFTILKNQPSIHITSRLGIDTWIWLYHTFNENDWMINSSFLLTRKLKSIQQETKFLYNNHLHIPDDNEYCCYKCSIQNLKIQITELKHMCSGIMNTPLFFQSIIDNDYDDFIIQDEKEDIQY
jgi:hypothetical protein